MKIAIIAHSLFPVKEPFESGLEMITFLLCKSLSDLGHTVHLYAHEGSDSRFNVFPIMENPAEPHAEVRGYCDVMMCIADGDYDLIHNHSLHYIPIIIGNGLDTPMITSIHTPQFDFLKFGAKAVLKKCNQTFTMVSESLARTWKDLIPNAEIVYNGIDLSKWNFVSKPSGDYLFWYGRICHEKGTHLAINAAIQSGHKIIFAGPVSNRGYYEEFVEPLINLPNVEYVGHISQDHIRPLLQNSKLLLFTSIWEEPYGLTLAEALACGTPVVAYQGGATEEILTDFTGVVVPKGSVFKFVKAIHRAKRLNRKDCRRRAEDFCSHINMVNSYLRLYDAVMEHRDYKLRRII